MKRYCQPLLPWVTHDRDVFLATEFQKKIENNSDISESRRMLGDGHKEIRQEHDFYSTSFAATEKLLKVEKFAGEIWECCCGDGAITKVLQSHNYNVYSSDLYDRGYGETNVNFLSSNRTAINIITNPPFQNSIEFLVKANRIATKKVAFLLPLRYLEGKARGIYYSINPPSRVWVFSKRAGMYKDGVEQMGGLMAFAWFVWDKKTKSKKTTLGWI